MSEDDVIKLAEKAGLPFWNTTGVPIHLNELKKFARLVSDSKKDKAPNSKALCDND
jgi:hypothetical protein